MYIMYMMYISMQGRDRFEEKAGEHRVAFTAFRNGLAGYLEKLAQGEEIVIYDARRARTIVALKGIKK